VRLAAGILIFSENLEQGRLVFFLEFWLYIAKANITDIFEDLEFGLIAPTESFAKLCIAHTEYTVSQKTIDGEINTICDFRYVDVNAVRAKIQIS
jgi:hypothetical protein